MSTYESSDSSVSKLAPKHGDGDGAFVKMVESGQIGFRLAEEIKVLREELLTLKQEKRILLVSNENLEDSIVGANNTISAMHAKLLDLQHHVRFVDQDLAKKEGIVRIQEEDLHQLKKQLHSEKKKNKLLAEELERSLEDEVALRGYSRRLEQDFSAQKNDLGAALEKCVVEREERLKCEQLMDSSLRSQLIFQKKLETVVYYCDKDADINSVAMFDVGPDYLEKLLRDVASEHAGRSQGSNNGSSRFDWSVLEQKQNHIDYQLNQYLNSIRAHVSKHRRAQKKSRKHVRSLLEVIRTYEELSIAAEGGEGGPQSPRALQVRYDALQDDDDDDDDGSDRRRIRAHRDKHAYKMEQKNTRSSGDRQWPNARHPHHSDEDLEDPVRQNFHYTYSQENHTATAARKGEHQNEVQNGTSTHQNGAGQSQGESSRGHPTTSSPSAPPHRHQRPQERDPVHSSAPGTLSPARQRPSGTRFRSQSPPPHSPPHTRTRTHSGRTLSLLEQLQREMERELQQRG